ncbi:MAG: hypothetical protein INR69_04970 [Mucilaginibacter polytrichastri]|nr:hypothetical protein [Mucilaginibacter polytrichastri]
MTKLFKIFLTSLGFLYTTGAMAQSTGSSPYSTFGLGELQEQSLPQFRAMGGIGTAVRRLGGYNNINLANPASYADISLTTIDVGAQFHYMGMRQGSVSDKAFNGSLSHVAFAFPLFKRSALSFGLLPYSNVGYNYQNSSSIDTSRANFIYSGEGGISKAYVGYAFGIGKNLSIGGNVSYLFGDIRQFRSTEMPEVIGATNSRFEDNRSIYGFSYDYGIQYAIPVSKDNRIVIGYSGTAQSKINSKYNFLAYEYRKDGNGDILSNRDTIALTEGFRKILLPMTHKVGLSFEASNRLLIGGEYRMGKWADLREGEQSSGLNNTMGFSLGGQLTPNLNAVSGYYNLVDYRLGVKYDKLYYNVNNNDIKQYAVTAGFGFPLKNDRFAYYKVNVTFEYGQRGALTDNLVKENYFNMHLGFLLNDLWFRKRQYD